MSTRGQRLADYLRRETGGRYGWQADLVRRSGIKRQTISKWTHPAYDGYPELEHLAALATALGRRPWELVAVLDGDEPLGTEERVREVVREELAAAGLVPPR